MTSFPPEESGKESVCRPTAHVQSMWTDTGFSAPQGSDPPMTSPSSLAGLAGGRGCSSHYYCKAITCGGTGETLGALGQLPHDGRRTLQPFWGPLAQL